MKVKTMKEGTRSKDNGVTTGTGTDGKGIRETDSMQKADSSTVGRESYL
jgi:hypothetical protein